MTNENPASETPPVDKPETTGFKPAKSLVIVNTGEGKGKSTAAFGTVLRALARGWKVGVVQFLKSGDWHVGEEKICRELGVDWFAAGDGFTGNSEDLDESRAMAQGAWDHAKGLMAGDEYRLLVLDEISYAMSWGWIDAEDVARSVAERSERLSVVLTGRDMAQEVIDVADTATEMRKIKHAFDSGIVAKKGIDY
ncbi:MAG: cob(I)yrinic acid a,c-diamide adenosyltransferase [Acidimicrobiales bacterium]